ncbi:MAG: hypothetical protein LBD52_00125 [Prevotellaceae bacterium]|jgi:hypothetical protein|nr:hypothetical protein [Prevotellaceae bacterium]
MNNFFTARKGLTEAIASTFRKNYPTFFPNLPFFQEWAIGDFGLYEDGVFIKKGNLADLGVQYDCSPPHNMQGMFFNCSSAHTSCQEFGGQADSKISPVKPTLSVKLEQENAYFCRGALASQLSLLDPSKAMERHLNFLKTHKAWDTNYCIISSVYMARNFIFMAAIGNAVQASAELNYTPTTPSSAEAAVFSQAAVHYDITKKTNIGHIICTSADTPQVVACMQMLKLKRGNLMNYKGLGAPPREVVSLDEEEQFYVLSIVDE